MLRDILKQGRIPSNLEEFMQWRTSNQFLDLRLNIRWRLKDIFRFAWWSRGYTDEVVVYYDLHRKYAEYRRSYHNLEHVIDLLCTLYVLEPVLKEEAFLHQADYEEIVDELILLIFFHDAIYEPGNKNNEEESSYYFLSIARPFRTTLIPEHIRATKEHRDLNVDGLIPKSDVKRIRNEIYLRKLLFDLDLASLGFSSFLFQEYRRKVEEEYPGVPKEVIKEGTKEFFKNFMQDRPAIYQTKTFRQIFEEQAQRNIKKLIDDSQ